MDILCVIVNAYELDFGYISKRLVQTFQNKL